MELINALNQTLTSALVCLLVVAVVAAAGAFAFRTLARGARERFRR